jgi:hypothetical protein
VSVSDRPDFTTWLVVRARSTATPTPPTTESDEKNLPKGTFALHGKSKEISFKYKITNTGGTLILEERLRAKAPERI